MVSVLMCTYNREGTLRQAIDSVLNQTYRDFEFLIMDDGSTDQTEELVASYNDKRIQYYKMSENMRYCYTANYGLTLCKGEYVAFVNSDDAWMEDKLEKQMGYFQDHPECGAVFSTTYLMDMDGNDVTEKYQDFANLFHTRFETQGEYMQYILAHGNLLCHPSAVVKRELIDQAGGFDLMYFQLADLDLWIKIITEYPIYVFDEPLVRFRWNPQDTEQVSSATREHGIRTVNEQVMIRQDMIERLSDEQMKQFFGNRFRNKNAQSHTEIELEKAFLLMACMAEAPSLKVLGLRQMEKALRIPGAADVLHKTYGIKMNDIYQLSKDIIYAEEGYEEQRKNRIEMIEVLQKDVRILQGDVETLQGDIQKLLNENQGLYDRINQYEQSRCWRWTKPFRNLKTK